MLQGIRVVELAVWVAGPGAGGILADWGADERYADARSRRRNSAELTALLDAAFATRDLADWAERFDREDLWWAPVQTQDEVVRDPTTGPGASLEPPRRGYMIAGYRPT
jgi:crotonobetainyl-CoA:carnitine CoA-transferase CaiB-like acyl-CoA transferase